MTKTPFREESYGPKGTTRFGAKKPPTGTSIAGSKERKEIVKSKKPDKVMVNRSVRALSARGKPPKINPHKLDETIRVPVQGSLTADYQIIDDNNRTVGFAQVVNGVIETLDYLPDASQSFQGQILSSMLTQIVAEADRNLANLSIELMEPDGDVKFILEGYGFRISTGLVMKRNHGAIRPTGISSPQGMVNRDFN